MRYLLFILVLVSCSESDDIEGTYACSYEYEFGYIADTLIVQKAEVLYQIERRRGVVKQVDGETFPKKLKSEQWVLKYNAEKKTLFELKKGRLLLVGERSLQFGKHQYKRI